MAKPNQPQLHEVEVTFPNGKKVTILSTKPGNIRAEYYPLDLPAWTGENKMVKTTSERSEGFEEKYGSINFGLDD